MPIPLTAYQIDSLPPPGVIFGQSRSMSLVREAVDRVAGTNLPVLISGESGTGKEVIAKLIHRASPLRDSPFVKVSCPTLRVPPRNGCSNTCGGALEDPDAFTDQASFSQGGTLFLDEVAELNGPMQAEFLGLFQDESSLLPDGYGDLGAKMRAVSSTSHLRLEDEVRASSFRHDLYYRISVVSIEVPPLRRRRDDIPMILKYFIDSYGKRYGRHLPPFRPHVIRHLQKYEWPGNIIQLENFVKRYVILGPENPWVAEVLHSRGGRDLMRHTPTDQVACRFQQ